MSTTVSVRLARKKASKIPGQNRHDLRTGKIPAYVDPRESPRNSIIVAPQSPAQLRAICEERRAQRGLSRALRRDAAVGMAGIVTFGNEAQAIIKAMPTDRQDDLFLRASQAVAERLGTTVTGLVIHRDESAPHAHFQMVGFSKEGHPLSNILTPKIASELQDIVGEVYREYGITRGTPKAERIARGDDLHKIVHRSVAKLHEDLPREIEAREKQVADIQAQIEALQEKRAYQQKLITKAEADIAAKTADEARLAKRLQTYQRRLADTETQITEKAQILSTVSKPLMQQMEEALAQTAATLRTVGIHAGRILGVQTPERKHREVIRALVKSDSLESFRQTLRTELQGQIER